MSKVQQTKAVMANYGRLWQNANPPPLASPPCIGSGHVRRFPHTLEGTKQDVQTQRPMKNKTSRELLVGMRVQLY